MTTHATALHVDTDGVLDRPRRGRARVLVTNDDGIESPGLHHLARALAPDHDVVVVAPRHNMSGTGTGMGVVHDTIPLERRDIDDIEAYVLDGPPGLAVMSAALGAFGPPPDLVVSGVNAGLNTGHSIIHSGTVGAALTAHTFGGRGIAVSLAPSEPWHWETAAPLAARIARWALDHRPRTTLNVNVPAVPPDQVTGIRWAPLDSFGHFNVASADPAAEELTLEVTDRSTGRSPDSDTALCLGGYVTLTAIEPVGEATPPGVSATAVLEHFEGP